jgi:2,4-dienoyl-CoA reductase-like NADH-dependent reductase (Old Yellow Enzyme family)/thioredoxin reductase
MTQRSSVLGVWTPGKIGSMTLRNRIVMPAIGTRLSTEQGLVSDRLKGYYRARAKGGAGLIITEVSHVDSTIVRTVPAQLRVDNDRCIPGLRELAQAIQQEGAKAALQLHNPGAMAKSSITGTQPVAPSAIPRFPALEVPRALTIEEIKYLVSCFADGARRAKEAGFDGVEIHAGHQYLLQEFLSRTFNHRQDEYGGSIENRARFLLEVIRAIRKLVGKDYPLWFRINAVEDGGGITVDEVNQIAAMAKEAGIDAINVSASPSVRTEFSPRGWNLPLAQEVKKAINLPIITVGRLTIELGNEAIKNGQTDFIVIGRPLIADPNLPLKTANKREEDIIPCIECNICIEESPSTGRGVECSVNSEVGHEEEYRIEPTDKPKKVLVIGGGPAGMEAARVAALRGHKVLLYERNGKLGGQLLQATRPPYKEEIAMLKDYLVQQLHKSSVEIRLNEDVDLNLVDSIKPDVVILATGILPLVPQIPGIDGENVVTSDDVLSDKVEVGQRVTILGGGLVGCETALLLAENKRVVTIVEMLPALATKVGPSIRTALLAALSEKGVTMLTKARVEEITSTGIVVTNGDGKRQTIDADNIVLATGAVPNQQLAEILKGRVKELFLIGDAVEPRRIKEAISEGYHTGRKI